MRRARTLTLGVAAAIGVIIAAPLAGSAATVTTAAPAFTVPTTTTPQVTVPSVSTPVTTTPSVTTPAVTTPAVTVPAVTPPPVTVPAAPGSPSAPSSPSLPPAAGSVAQHVGAAAGAVTGATSAAGTPGSTGAGAGGPAAGSTPAQAGFAAAGSTATPASAHPATASAASARRASDARARAQTRRLRRLVTALHGCLARLSASNRHLLSLRAGLHGPARSSAAVARILHVRAGRERRLERAALVSLLRAAATRGCAGASGRDLAHSPMAMLALSQTAPQSPVAAPQSPVAAPGAASPATAPAAGSQVSDASRRRARPRQSVVVLSSASTRSEQRASTGPSGASTILIGAFVILVMSFAVVAARMATTPRVAGPARAPGHVGAEDAAAVAAASIPVAVPRTSTTRPSPSSGPATTADTPPRLGDDAAEPRPLRLAPRPSADMPTTDIPPVSPRPATPVAAPPAAALPPSVPARSPGPGWVHEHVTQAALLAGVLAGGLARLVTGRHRRPPHH